MDFADRVKELVTEDCRTSRSDGKIPVYETRKEKLQNDEVGLGALMTVSAL